MNIVMVKHNGDNRQYCFEVPDGLVSKIKNGSRLLCATRRGQQPAIAQAGVISGDGAEDIARQNGAKFPLAKIVGVFDRIEMSEIKVPNYFTRTIPATEKIAKRIDEYRKTGAFNMNIVVKDGVLTDGYTAYLVCKMLGHRTIPYLTV